MLSQATYKVAALADRGLSIEEIARRRRCSVAKVEEHLAAWNAADHPPGRVAEAPSHQRSNSMSDQSTEPAETGDSPDVEVHVDESTTEAPEPQSEPAPE